MRVKDFTIIFSIDFNNLTETPSAPLLDLLFSCLIIFLTAVSVRGVKLKLFPDGLSRYDLKVFVPEFRILFANIAPMSVKSELKLSAIISLSSVQ